MSKDYPVPEEEITSESIVYQPDYNQSEFYTGNNIAGYVNQWEPIKTFSSINSGDGICIDPTDGSLWILNADDSTVTNWSRTGEQNSQFTIPDAPVDYPSGGITIDPVDGNLWLSVEPGYFREYSLTGSLLSEYDWMAKNWHSSYECTYIGGIAIDPVDRNFWHNYEIDDGSVYMQIRVEKFDREGNQISGTLIANPDGYNNLWYGLAVHPGNGDIYIGRDADNDVSKILDRDGNVIDTPGYPIYPVALTIDPVDGSTWMIENDGLRQISPESGWYIDLGDGYTYHHKRWIRGSGRGIYSAAEQDMSGMGASLYADNYGEGGAHAVNNVSGYVREMNPIYTISTGNTNDLDDVVMDLLTGGIWGLDGTDGRLIHYDRKTGDEITEDEITVPTGALSVDRDINSGNYWLGYDGSLKEIDSSGTVLTDFASLAGPIDGIAVMPTNGDLVCAETDPDSSGNDITRYAQDGSSSNYIDSYVGIEMMGMAIDYAGGQMLITTNDSNGQNKVRYTGFDSYGNGHYDIPDAASGGSYDTFDGTSWLVNGPDIVKYPPKRGYTMDIDGETFFLKRHHGI